MATLLPVVTGVSAVTLYVALGGKRNYDLYSTLGTTSLLSSSYVLSGLPIKPYPLKIYSLKTYGVSSLVSVSLSLLIAKYYQN
jgi:hypothetical protein